jgi:beta-glucosidase
MSSKRSAPRGRLAGALASTIGALALALVPSGSSAHQTNRWAHQTRPSDRHPTPGRDHGRPDWQPPGRGQPLYENSRVPLQARVDDLLSRMTLAEKVGQMTQGERAAVEADPTQITKLNLGALLSGGGSVPKPNTPEAWANMVDRFQHAALETRLHIPIIYGIDSVHGDGNMYGATVFPHNIGLGATRDPRLVEEVEHVTAAETRASGPQWTFAPCICAARDDRWGRTYESFSESPQLVEEMESAIEGFQGPPGHRSDADRVLATAKHFAGDGDTTYGTSTNPSGYTIDQGIDITSRFEFWENALQQYVPAVRRYHVATVMPSYSSVDWTEDGTGNPIKMTADRELITGFLKQKLGFDGFVISDWEAIHQLPGNYAEQVRTAVNAGVDMFMEPFDFETFEQTLIKEVQAGEVPMSRIDDAVRRILAKKFELGLFEHPYTNREHLGEIGDTAHRAVARRAAAESQVLLKNSSDALPLRPHENVYVAGSNANNLGNQAGGWTLTWQGGSTNKIPGTTILEGIEQADSGGTVTFSEDASAPVPAGAVGVVVVGETPYAEGYGDVGGPQYSGDPGDEGKLRPVKDMKLSATDKAAVDKVCAVAAKCVLVIVSGRPLILEPPQQQESDAIVAAWLPGSEGEGVADPLFGYRPYSGKLSVSWPKTLEQEPINVGEPHYEPLYPFSWGLHTY